MALAGIRSASFSFGSHNKWRGSALAALIVLSAVTSPAAQAPPAPADAAVRAYREGRYDEVQRVLKNANDPRSVALKARALSAVGRYGEAEKMLTPVASSAPTSDATLELGLLQHELGRRDEARKTLVRLLDGLPDPRTAADLQRFGRASASLADIDGQGPERTAA